MENRLHEQHHQGEADEAAERGCRLLQGDQCQKAGREQGAAQAADDLVGQQLPAAERGGEQQVDLGHAEGDGGLVGGQPDVKQTGDQQAERAEAAKTLQIGLFLPAPA